MIGFEYKTSVKEKSKKIKINIFFINTAYVESHLYHYNIFVKFIFYPSTTLVQDARVFMKATHTVFR